MPRRSTSSPVVRVDNALGDIPRPEGSEKKSKKEKYRVRFASDDESSSEDEDFLGDHISEEDRRLRKQHAEEIEKYIEDERNNLTRLLAEFPDDTKLTRRKAKELNHDIIAILNLGGIQQDETSSVLAEDFDDEEDDEYDPNEDDEDASDEYSELSNTFSDVDSQPRTPGSALGAGDDVHNNSAQYDEDEGIFKVPGEPPKTPKTPKRDETISKRTRSKISLEETPIEAFEVPLPLEFKTDLYDTDLDPDESWQEFLKDFQMPLKSLQQEEEEETDPEWNVAHTSEAGDVDEAEDIPITDAEVRALIDGLLEGNDHEFVEEEPQSQNLTECTAGYTSTTQYLQPPDPNNPLNVVTSTIQPVAIIHTEPSLSPNYEMVLGADNQIYVLSRPDLRRLAPGIFKRSPEEKPVTSPIITVDVTKDTDLLLDEIAEHREAYAEHFNSNFNESHRRRLQIQLMKHVQFLGTSFLQSYGHSKFWESSDHSLKKLKNLVVLSRKSPSLRNLCWNLRDMYKLCLDWQEELKKETEATQDYIDWMLNNERSKRERVKFHPQVMECIVTSKAFVFSELLPKISVGGCRSPMSTQGEHKLLILSLAELKRQTANISLTECVKAFTKHYCPRKTPGSIMMLFRRDRHHPVIEAYRDRGEVPEVIPETMDLVSYDEVVTPSQRGKGTLPPNWNDYVFSKERIKRVFPNYVNPINARQPLSARPVRQIAQTPTLVATNEEPLVTLDYKGFRAAFNLPQQTALVSSNPKTQKVKKAAKDTRPSQNVRRPGLSKQKSLKLIEHLVNNSSRKSKSLEQIRKRKQLTGRFHRLVKGFIESYDDRIGTLNEGLISTKIFNYLKEFDIFARLLGTEEVIAAEMEGTTPSAAKRLKLDGEETGQQSAKRTMELNRKLLKAQRMYDNNRLLLQPEPLEVVKERDSLFAWNYVYKVRETYLAEGRPEKMDEFLRILRNVKATDSVPVLYNKIEKLFLPDHRELVDTFLAFLLPGHAAQIGKFFDHFMVTSMTTLVTKLKIYFEKQPNQWKKIMNTLNELSTEDGVSMATIKQRFLPLLKGNPLLIDWFMQLFPTERAPEPRDDEFEELQTKNELPFEEIPASLILAEQSDSTPACGIRYMQGRIQYGNRYILPADLSFLATSYELEVDKPQKSVSARKSKRGAINRQEPVEEEVNDDIAAVEVIHMESPTKQPQQHPVGCIHAISPAWDFKADDGEEQGGSSSANNFVREELLCDAATLRAHKNRLNPSLGTDANATGGTNDEAKTSPKKTTEWKTTSISTRGGTRRAAATIPSAPVSPKKATNVTGGSPKKTTATEGSRRKRSANNQNKSGTASVDEKKQATSQQEQPVIEKTETAAVESASAQEWTREEDKILLEAINGQEDKTEEQILNELVAAIPGRLRGEINTRFRFLINIITDTAWH